MLEIPTSGGEPFYSQVSTIEGVDYTLTFRFSQRENCYYLTIGDNEGVDILKGIKLVCKWPLTAWKRQEGLPPGEFMVLSNNGDNTNPGVEDLGSDRRCQLYYLEESEIL